MNRYASRKFLLSLFVVMSADALLWLHAISAAEWATTVGFVVAAYIGGNVGQKATQK